MAARRLPLACSEQRELPRALMATEEVRCSPRAFWPAMMTMDCTGGSGVSRALHFCRRRRRCCRVVDDGLDFLRLGFWLPPCSCLALTPPLRARRLNSHLATLRYSSCSPSPSLVYSLFYFFSSVFLLSPSVLRARGQWARAESV